MDAKFEDAISLNNSGEKYSRSERIFITSNLKIKENTPYHIVVIQASILLAT
jgi:hypothetical protein